MKKVFLITVMVLICLGVITSIVLATINLSKTGSENNNNTITNQQNELTQTETPTTVEEGEESKFSMSSFFKSMDWQNEEVEEIRPPVSDWDLDIHIKTSSSASARIHTEFKEREKRILDMKDTDFKQLKENTIKIPEIPLEKIKENKSE